MIVFSDRKAAGDPRALLDRLLRGLGSPAPDPTLLLIEAGTLEAAVLDAASPERDGDDSEADRAWGAAMLDLAAAARGDRARLEPARRRLAALAPGLPPGPLPLPEPEGFAFYALYPEAYAEAARRYLRVLRPTSALVLGLRGIGTTLSAVVAAELEAQGVPARRLTVRPRGHPWDRELRLSEEHRAALAGAQQVLVVDEGPGISGTSFAAAVEAAEAAGVPPSRIHLFPSWDSDGSSLRSPRARAAWTRVRRWCVPFEALFLDGQGGRLAAAWGGGTLRDIGGGLWRALSYLGGEDGWPAVQPQHERRKYLLERPDGARLLLKFAGLGPRGERALARAEAQAGAGRAPPVLGLRDGFLALAWVEGTPAAPRGGAPGGAWLDAMAAHLAALSREERGGARAGDLLAMTRLNIQEGLGEAAANRAAWMEGMRDAVAARPAVAGDGRMLPQEWLRTPGGILKCDGIDHHDDHFWPGPQDPVWDLAGAAAEWSLAPPARERLIAAYERLTGDRGARAVLPFYEVAYPAWRLGYAAMASESLGPEGDGRRMARLRDRYARALHRALERGP